MILDESVVVQLEALGREVLLEIVSLYLVCTPVELSRLEGALARGETATVAQLTHKLRGSSLSVGAVRMAAVIAEVEASLQHADLSHARDPLRKIRVAFRETEAAFDGRLSAGVDASTPGTGARARGRSSAVRILHGR